MKEEAMSRKFLPEEVVVEILLRLPVKSLVRFRCVSKRWLSLISDPRFAKSQFKRAADHIQRLLFPTPFGLGSLEVDAPFGDGSALRELFVPFKQPDLRLNLLGSCDGLVFASHYDHKDFYVWNPSTGEHRKLPDPGISPHPDNEYMYGFGYDSSIDNYKVIVIAFLPPRPCPGYVGKILSLKNDLWKSIKKPDNVFTSFRSAGALCGGAVHWLGGVFRPGPNLAILAFDLAEEKFRQVPMPPMLEEEDNEDYYDIAYTCLVNLGGRLCLILLWDADEELWGMMEYGVQKSWARMFRIDGDYSPQPLCMSRGNQLVATNDDGNVLIRANPEGKIVESCVFCIEQSPNWHEPSAVFVESLLSPLFALEF
ncbi:hypothetical protein I3842_07G037700 [Carya illinoinensis]|uniref:F-box domain-containing protein n=1 Tax=Carya illinoinensis TaxID=32201 RepID=A0A922JCF3_CARIL|nr:hypothetical protein I3842_07G037700 [Carya illinoinensis]